MKVYPEKLGTELARKIAPVYTISGDEPLLVQESCDLVRSALRKAEYTERDLFHVEGNFDWEQVLFSANSMSLFAQRKILELRMPSGKPGDKGAAALVSYTESIPSDTVMLIVLPKLDASSQRAKWFKALESAGVFVQVWPIELAQMPRWIDERFRKAGLSASREAALALIERVEGNLLAAIQEIERLRLVKTDKRVGLNDILEAVADTSRYDVFSLLDAAVGQDELRTLKIVRGLQMEGTEILYVTAMIARELRTLAAIAAMIESGQSLDAAMASSRIWPKRRAIVGRYIRQHRLTGILSLLAEVSRIDKMIKGIGRGDPWSAVTDLALSLAGRPPIEPPRGQASPG